MQASRFKRMVFRGRLGVCRSLGWLLAGTVLAGWARADVRLAGVFGDRMVLQRDVEVPVRGWAGPGETVTVQFGGQTIRATTGNDGAWSARLAPMKATATGQDLVVSGSQTVRLSDVLVGDVWLCSGQSNMRTGFDRRPPPLDPGPMDLPQIRYGAVPNFADIAPRTDGVVFWVVSGPNTVPRYSAFPWFFGQRLHQEAKVPIGILRASWGGATIENWMSPDGLRQVDELKPLYRDYIAVAHRYGKKAFMHSDGNIAAIYPDLVEIGLDAVNSQLFCMDIEKLGREYAGKITFWGEIDRQYLLPFGARAEIIAAVTRVKQALYCHGGVIAQCAFDVGAKPENVMQVFETWEKLWQ